MEKKIKKLENCVEEKDKRIKELESFREKIKLITEGIIVIIWLAIGILVQILIFWATAHIWNLAGGLHFVLNDINRYTPAGDPITSLFLGIAFFAISGLFWYIWMKLLDNL